MACQHYPRRKMDPLETYPQPLGSDRITVLELHCSDIAAVIADLGSRVNRVSQRSIGMHQLLLPSPKGVSPPTPDAAALASANPNTNSSARSFGGKVWTKRAKGTNKAKVQGSTLDGNAATDPTLLWPFDTLSELFAIERPLTRRQIKVSAVYLSISSNVRHVHHTGECGPPNDPRPPLMVGW